MLDDNDQKFAYSVDDAALKADISRVKIYDAINTGKLRARKSGRRTLILAADLQAFLGALPCFVPKSAR